MIDFAADKPEETLCHRQRRDEQGAVVVDFGMRGEVVEDHVHALGDLRIAGEQAKVGIEARGDGVVVAGAEMAVAAVTPSSSRRTSMASLQCVLRPTTP